jgi:hypothetical protein
MAAPPSVTSASKSIQRASPRRNQVSLARKSAPNAAVRPFESSIATGAPRRALMPRTSDSEV